MCAAIRGETKRERRDATGRDGRIPAFFLYGESGGGAGDDFVHVEDIAARSSLYGWEIDRHVHQGLCQILVVVEGGVDLRLDDVETSPSAPCAVVVPPGTVHAFRFRPGTIGHVLTFAERGLTRAATEREALVESLFARPAVTGFADRPDVLGRVTRLLEEIGEEFHGAEPGRAVLLDWLVSAVLTLLARAVAAPWSRSARPEADLFARFRALVERAHAEHRPISWYAATLGVGESSLDRAARAVVGTTAFEVVQERLALEARRRLIYIAAPVSRLAYELGFEDPAYFWRFFKRRTGLTPNAFRRMARARATAIGGTSEIGDAGEGGEAQA